MISKEQIAHELTIIYLNNRYGIDVCGSFNFLSYDEAKVNGSGSVETNHFPSANEPKNIKVGTGHKGFLGFEKRTTVQDGYLVDDIFIEMVDNYHNAYSKFLNLLGDKKENIL